MLSTDSNTDATWPSLALEAWSDTYTTRVLVRQRRDSLSGVLFLCLPGTGRFRRSAGKTECRLLQHRFSRIHSALRCRPRSRVA